MLRRELSSSVIQRSRWTPYLISSYVSPRSGLKGLPVLSHWEATAETAKAATDCKQFKDGSKQIQPRQQHMSALPTGYQSQALSQSPPLC